MASEPIVVLIGGGHASGKRTTALLLKKELEKAISEADLDIKIVNLEDYEQGYVAGNGMLATSPNPGKGNGNGENSNAESKPSRFDFERVKSDIETSISASTSQSQIMIVYGLYALYDKELRQMSRMKVFITVDADTRLLRWIKRDVLEGEKSDLNSIITSYLSSARSEMSNFIFPTKEFADVVLPRGAEYNAVRLLVDGLIPLISSDQQSHQYFHYEGNILRPSGEQFDRQKGNFYELT